MYAGLSGMYFVRDKFPSLANGPELPGLPFPAYDGTIDPLLVRELPLAIQDRAFTNESQLWYPVADHSGNESLPAGKVSPRSLPEFSATVTANGMPVNMVMMVVNGRTYPRQVREWVLVEMGCVRLLCVNCMFVVSGCMQHVSSPAAGVVVTDAVVETCSSPHSVLCHTRTGCAPRCLPSAYPERLQHPYHAAEVCKVRVCFSSSCMCCSTQRAATSD